MSMNCKGNRKEAQKPRCSRTPKRSQAQGMEFLSWFEHCVISAKSLCPYFYPIFSTQESHSGKELSFPRGMPSTECNGGF